ncbi:MAG: exodeoxyribonuclease VII large subunit [Candidatus Latescibacterota bacterium]|jgi:exodeoxyribonuclease VII large subunit
MRPPSPADPADSLDLGGRPLTVSEITAMVKATLEASLPMCWIVGEVSGYTHHASGHRYFTLKDEGSQLSAVIFKWQARSLAFEPEAGMQVMAYGHITVYERGGRYQLLVSQLQPAGVGELAAAFERLKNRLEAEGLFAPERKRPLPPYPRTVGIVTSPTGAAIRDVIQILRRRAPGVQLVLRPARVQGPGAAEEIAAGIADLNRLPGVDILIVGRGGGSPEDLWPFNEEIVARAIYRSARPVISAVGHEVDYTIADYVADYRAPTPSAAAEIVAQEHGQLRRHVVEHRRRLRYALGTLLGRHEQRLRDLDPERLGRRLCDRLDQLSLRVDERTRDLTRSLDWDLRSRLQAFRQAAGRLAALSPLGQLARGYCVCERPEDGLLVRRAGDLKPGDRLRLRFHQGSATTVVEETGDA